MSKVRNPITPRLTSSTNVLAEDLVKLKVPEYIIEWFVENNLEGYPVDQIRSRYSEIYRAANPLAHNCFRRLIPLYITTGYDKDGLPVKIGGLTLEYDELDRVSCTHEGSTRTRYEYDDDGGWTKATAINGGVYCEEIIESLLKKSLLSKLFDETVYSIVEMISRTDTGWFLVLIINKGNGTVRKFKRYDHNREFVEDVQISNYEEIMD